MNEEEFWKIIASSRQGASNLENQIITLRAQLTGLSPNELLEFRYHWDRLSERAFCWPLWDAAALLAGGIDEDTFMDFRAWLVSLGQETFEAALADPDSLAELWDSRGDVESSAAESLNYLIEDVYTATTGQHLPLPTYSFGPAEPAGEKTDLSDFAVVSKRFPRLVNLHESQRSTH